MTSQWNDRITEELVEKFFKHMRDAPPLVDAPWLKWACVQEAYAQSADTQDDRQKALLALAHRALAVMAVTSSNYANILTKLHVDGCTAAELQEAKYNISATDISKANQRGWATLAKILREMEATAAVKQTQILLRQLGKLVQRVGTADLPNQLAEILLSGENLALTGMGGSGKTTLAKAIAERVFTRYKYSRYVTVIVDSGGLAPLVFQHKLAAALQIPSDVSDAVQKERIYLDLQQTATLILVDNVETDIADLFDVLDEWSNPSQFLITVREQPSIPGRIRTYALGELTRAEAADLLRQEAQYQNRPQLVEAAEADLDRIFDKVGGHPLALKLVVSLNHQDTIPQILEHLEKSNRTQVRELYDHIYFRVWHSLPPVAQEVLRVMEFTAEDGMERSFLMEAVRTGWGQEIQEQAIYDVFDTLVQRSLLQLSGSAWDDSYLYSVHNLTRTFLKEHVSGWDRQNQE